MQFPKLMNISGVGTSRFHIWFAATMLFSLLLIAGCVSHDPGNFLHGDTTITGTVFRAYDNHPASAFEVLLVDTTPKNSPFGLVGPRTLGRSVTDQKGQFILTITEKKVFEKARDTGNLGIIFRATESAQTPPWQAIRPFVENEESYYIE